MLYESPVPIVWKFALTSPWRPRLIERVCVWTRFKRNLRLLVVCVGENNSICVRVSFFFCYFQGCLCVSVRAGSWCCECDSLRSLTVNVVCSKRAYGDSDPEQNNLSDFSPFKESPLPFHRCHLIWFSDGLNQQPNTNSDHIWAHLNPTDIKKDSRQD